MNKACSYHRPIPVADCPDCIVDLEGAAVEEPSGDARADRVSDASAADDAEDGRRPSASTILVKLARISYDFGVTEDGDVFAIKKHGAHTVRMLRAGRMGLRAELASAYYSSTDKAAPQQALSDAMMVLEGIGRAAEPKAVHLRLAEHDGSTYLDMGDAEERVIRIGSGEWATQDDVPVLFKRTQLTGPLPRPVTGGDVSGLWEVVNVAEPDRPLVLAWLVHALISADTPHPILSLLAEQGSGKSSATKALVALVDPSPVPLRKPPKDADSWVTAASGSWVVAIDNLSGINDWLSDSLCRAVTGDGDVRRALYTDGEFSVFAFRRCLIVNGITLGALRGDYAERSLAVTLERIAPTARRSEQELAASWARNYPRIFGALLDLAAGAKKVLPSVRLESSPRMADFARTLAAVDQMLGTDGLARYLDQGRSLAVDSLESDPFCVVLGERLTDLFDGGAAQLLAHVRPAEPWKPPQGWPKNGNAVTGILTRNAPALRAAGWVVEDLGRGGKNHTKQWRLIPCRCDTPYRDTGIHCPPCPLARQPQVSGHKAGGQDGGQQAGSVPAVPARRRRGGHGGQRENACPPPCPPDSPPVTSGNGQAGTAGTDSPYLSMVGASGGGRPVCRHCGFNIDADNPGSNDVCDHCARFGSANRNGGAA